MATTKKARKPVRSNGPASPKHHGHVVSLSITGFRGFKHFEVAGLAPLTVVTGDNGAGKSTLLEAMFALYGRTNPLWVVNLQARRGLQSISQHGPSYLGLFHGGSEEGTSRISGLTAQGNKLRLEIARSDDGGRAVLVERNRRPGEADSVKLGNADIDGFVERAPRLDFRAFKDGSLENKSQLASSFSSGKFKLEAIGAIPSRPRAIMQHPSGGPLGDDDKTRYGDLEETDRSEGVLQLLREIDPRVEDVRFLQTSRTEYFRATLRNGQKLPLGMLGDGAVHVFRTAMDLADVEDGFLAIDEVENGIYFHRMPAVFAALVRARKRVGAQLMLATHSAEALKSLVKAAMDHDPDNLAVVHLRRETDDSGRATVFSAKDAHRSVELGYELR